MPRGEPRLAGVFPVEFERSGRLHVAISQDLCRGGLFVRTDVDVPIGEVVALGVRLPGGALVSLLARAAHRLKEEAALTLGRSPGIGFALIDLKSESARRLHTFLD